MVVSGVTTPVTLPPGRLRLATRPSCTGSAPIANTMGIVALGERQRVRLFVGDAAQFGDDFFRELFAELGDEQQPAFRQQAAVLAAAAVPTNTSPVGGIEEQGPSVWITMTDPEGNEFCILRSQAERGTA